MLRTVRTVVATAAQRRSSSCREALAVLLVSAVAIDFTGSNVGTRYVDIAWLDAGGRLRY